ncbi:MAG: T9SS type A sorting domain-containing protein [Aquaticitalea sp.]
MKKITLLLNLLIFQLTFSQNYTEYYTGNLSDATTNHQQGICLMGGASEKDEAMVWFLNKADGGDVVVLRASGSDGYNDYFFSDLGVVINSVRTFVVHNEAGATDPYVLDKVAKAEAIWFAGGDQYDYVTMFRNNEMETTLNNFINVKQGVIGGTSAGMAILGNYYYSAENGTVTSDEALSNPYRNDMTLNYNDFLEVPFMQNVVTDTHFDDRDRAGRLTTFMARFTTDYGMRSFGIACNEYTAVCVEPNGDAHVYGETPQYPEYAYFLQGNCVDNNIPETCVAEQPLTWNRDAEAVKVYKVPGTDNGTHYFNIANWNTGSGGTWQNWFVNTGTYSTISDTNPNCVLSVDEFKTSSINISPNPFSDVITIRTQLQNYEITIFDALGKQLLVDRRMDGTINTTHLSAGMYLLKIASSGSYRTFKMLKR